MSFPKILENDEIRICLAFSPIKGDFNLNLKY